MPDIENPATADGDPSTSTALAPSRRFVLAAGLGAASAVVLAACSTDSTSSPEDPMSGMGSMGSMPMGGDSGGSSPARSDDLWQPAVLRSHGGRLAATLTAAAGATTLGRKTHAFGYNGTSPGPTVRVRPGDVLQLKLTNGLDVPSNLHTHGLHVSPTGNSDNPFIEVQPGKSFDYSIRIPDDHPAGTFWYHPHHHMMVADQVFGGLFGAIVVEGDGDPEVDVDRVMVISDISLDDAGNVVEPSAAEKTVGRRGERLLVNGQQTPTVKGNPGETQRWRLINTTASRTFTLSLQGHQMTQIAIDGNYLPAPVEVDKVRLASGNRVDVLVQVSTAGAYEVRVDTEAMTMNGGGFGGGFGRGGGGGGMPSNVTSARSDVAARFVVSGAPIAGRALPTTLPADTRLPEPTASRTIVLGMNRGGQSGGGMSGMSGMTPAAFNIDGRTFDPQRDDQVVSAGVVEEWTVSNQSWMAHPFHIHVWPFTVVASSDGAALPGVKQDVVIVPAFGEVKLRVAFDDFTGRSVYHCHILDHEDSGMMATVRVGS